MGEDAQGRPGFVLHDHRRPRPHFDLRLEENGVLRSWAVPRGLPTSPDTDRLAIEVADHGSITSLTTTQINSSPTPAGGRNTNATTDACYSRSTGAARTGAMP